MISLQKQVENQRAMTQSMKTYLTSVICVLSVFSRLFILLFGTVCNWYSPEMKIRNSLMYDKNDSFLVPINSK